jgi:hypothetical protein
MSMECNEQDYLVSFLVVSGLVLRGYEREGKGRNGELRTESAFFGLFFSFFFEEECIVTILWKLKVISIIF